MALGGPLKTSWQRIALDTSTRASSSRTIGSLDVAHAHAAVVLADGDREEIGAPERLERGLGELLGLVPVGCVRCELTLGDVAGELPQRRAVLVFFELKRLRRHLMPSGRLHPAGTIDCLIGVWT